MNTIIDNKSNDTVQDIFIKTFNNDNNILTFDLYLWSLSTIWSRFISININNKLIRAMVPLIDLLNHDPSSTTSHILTSTNDFVIVSDNDTTIGEVYLNYGLISNSRLLQLYGFTLSNNQYESVDIFINMDSITITKEVQKVFNTININIKEPMKLTKESLNPKLIAVLRLQYCPTNILKNEMKILKFMTIVTKDIEVKVIETLKTLLQSMLSLFKTSINEDEILLNERSVIQNNRVYHAVNLRLSEKKILKENLLLLEAHEAQVLLNLKSSFSDSFSSTLILGCSSLAGLYQPIGEENSSKVIHRALEVGFTSFDTAPHYALGLGEQRLGRGLQNTTSIKVYTKAGRLILDENDIDSTMRIEHDNVPGSPNCIFPESPLNRIPVRNYTYQGIMKSYEDSLKRLNLNQGIFGLRIHDCEDEVSLHEVLNGGLAALIELKNKKMISEVSFGLNSAKVALLLLKEAKSQNLKVDSVMIAGSYNLLDHDIDCIKLFYFCQKEKIEIHNAGIYCSGILAGSPYYKYDIAPSDKLESLRQWTTLCDEYNFSVKEVALAFSLMPDVVSKVAVGVKSCEEVEELVQNYQRIKIIGASDIFKEAKKRRLLASHVII